MQLPAGVGRHRVAVLAASPTVQRSSGAKATRSASLPTAIAALAAAARPAGPARRPSTGRRRRAGSRAPGRRSRRPAAPPAARRCRPTRRRSRRRRAASGPAVHGEWSLTTRSIVAVGQGRPERLAVRPLADRRAALERRRAVGDLLRGEGQVVRAGLDGDPHALGPGRAAASAARRRRPGGRRARAPRCHAPRPRSAGRSPTFSAVARSGREETGVAAARSAPVRRR